MRGMSRFLKTCFIFLLLGMLFFSLTACSSSDLGESKETAEKKPADNYPERPIKLIVPFSAGGGSDRLCRTLAPYLGKELGVEVVVENQPGAGSQVGLTNLMNAKADGYTLSQANQPHTSFTIAVQNAPYKIDDFAWLNFHHIDPIAVNVLNDKPWKDLKELFDYIKEHPGEISIGCTQMSGPHVTMLYFQKEYGLDFTIVPYPGGGAGRAALVGGHIDVYFGNAFANYPLQDQSRCLGIGWDERSKLWPNAPTFHELFNDPKLDEFVKPMATFRGLVFSKEFKEKYPERWNKFVEAYNKAYHSEGHMKDSDKIGQTPIMHWTGPEEAEKLAKQADKIVQEYAHYFKK